MATETERAREILAAHECIAGFQDGQTGAVLVGPSAIFFAMLAYGEECRIATAAELRERIRATVQRRARGWKGPKRGYEAALYRHEECTDIAAAIRSNGEIL